MLAATAFKPNELAYMIRVAKYGKVHVVVDMRILIKWRVSQLMSFYSSTVGGSITFCLSLDDIRVAKHNATRTLRLRIQAQEDEDRGGLRGEEMRNEEDEDMKRE
jgi:hypothetical protein